MHARGSDGHQNVVFDQLFSHCSRTGEKAKSQVSSKVETKQTQTQTQPKTKQIPVSRRFRDVWIPNVRVGSLALADSGRSCSKVSLDFYRGNTIRFSLGRNVHAFKLSESLRESIAMDFLILSIIRKFVQPGLIWNTHTSLRSL